MASEKPPPPKNGVYIIQGEMLLVVTAMRRSSKWTSHLHQEEEQDPLLNSFSQLRDILNNISDLQEIEPNIFLGPFLDVIRSEDTTGPITGLALSSINKFLSYGLLEPCEEAASGIENIADAVTHARFVGTDPGSDEVVLMKILQVLRTLLLTPVGAFLSNESVCEIMQSCFRICFEIRLSELLRRSAEHTLVDMVQLLFARLPHFREEKIPGLRRLKMRAGGISEQSRRKHPRPSPKSSKRRERTNTNSSQDRDKTAPQHSSNSSLASADPSQPDERTNQDSENSVLSNQERALGESQDSLNTNPEERKDAIDAESADVEGEEHEKEADESASEAANEIDSAKERPDRLEIPDTTREEELETPGMETPQETHLISMQVDQRDEDVKDGDGLSVDQRDGHFDGMDEGESGTEQSDSASIQDSEYVNTQGVRFTPQQHVRHGSGPPVPYGLPCVRELFRFLISLINPYDKHNTEVMTHMGLSLLTVALETGCDHISASPSLLLLVKDDMCKNLFALLQTERLAVFASTLRVCFMLFESMRTQLKFQLEMYLHKLTDIIISESVKIPYEQREMALDSLVQLWRIPSLVSELYVNYDCDLFCSSLFEDLTKLLSKNAFPVSGSLFTTHLLSLEALLAVIDSIEANTQHRILNSIQSAHERTDADLKGEEEGDGRERTDSDIRRITFVSPPTTGYGMAGNISSVLEKQGDKSVVEDDKVIIPITRRVSRYSPSESLPSSEEICALKQRKKIVTTGADLFNQKPSKGVTYLQEKGILKTPTDYLEVAQFIRECPYLDKQMIGDYISAKKNVKVLEAFMRTFHFANTRIDEALRMYLETFRLPGEAPVIQHIMEHFAEHWHSCNNHPFANDDAAFTLGYAVIMLNVDQHNTNAKKQNIPMTFPEFKKNLKAVNGGKDFDAAMLEEVYNAIKNEEIVMPAEQTGLVKENYMWRVLLKRGQTAEGKFLHTGPGMYDKDLFLLTWGATVAALSFVFDKSVDDAIMQKALVGFRKCAMISAHYGLTDVFDNLIISLCKFSTLQKSESPETLPVSFGSNGKAQLAAKTVFSLAHRHGDILSEGWKNLLDCMLQLFRAKLLPLEMVEVEDFVEPKGKVSLIREEMPTVKSESGLLGSFYSIFSMNTEVSQQKIPTPEDSEAREIAKSCIEDCHPELLITESKFLRLESLHELVKALTYASQGPHAVEELGSSYDQEAAVFNVELLIRLVLENRDRVSAIWQSVCDHFYTLIVTPLDHSFLVERTVVGLLRIAIRLLRKEEVAGQVLSSLKLLLMMKVSVIHHVSRQIAFGLHELLKLNAANIHTSEDWYTLFMLLEVVGAGADPPAVMRVSVEDGNDDAESENLDAGAQSDSELSLGTEGTPVDHGYTSDSELYKRGSGYRSGSESETSSVNSSSWLVVNKDGKLTEPQNQFEITLDNKIIFHDTKALSKSCETLAFLVRDAAHVTPANFESCVHAIRTFVEATVNGGKLKHELRKQKHAERERDRKKMKSKSKGALTKAKSVPEAMSQMSEIIDDSDGNAPPGGYQALSIQLLDLMHTLHTRAASIFSSWAEEEQNDGQAVTIDAGTSALWVKCWCPLLQGIARLCCDTRRQVRMQALTYLQRALLVHDLQTLSALEWESCFNKVLFPLLAKLLETNSHNPTEMEETRMRAASLLCKGFLQHLTLLLSLSTFTALWLTILDFMDKYMHTDKSELLSEAIPESLKNMLLVMDTHGVFQTDGGDPEDPASQLWVHTWERINDFLPGLRDEVFKPREPARVQSSIPSQDSIPRDVGESTETNTNDPASSEETTETPNPSPEAPIQENGRATPEQRELQPPPAPSNVSQAPVITQKVPQKKPSMTPAPVPVNVTQVTPQSNIILQPPLPSLVPPGPDGTRRQGGTIPLIIDPRVLQGTNLPTITVNQAQTAGSGT